jgi:hypothetical protein
MEKISGYARVIARAKVQQETTKPFFGKPYLKYGQCYGMWSYFFQLGGILGGRHSANLDAFGPAFLGAHGPPGAVRQVFTEVAKRLVADSVRDSMKFQDYVSLEFTRRVGYSGDARTYFAEHGMEKLPPSTAEELAWQYSESGAALGAIYPQVVRQMFIQTHAPVPKDKWQQMRAAGLNLPPEQDAMSYEETEKGENEAFMLYCRECCPELSVVLNK